jgi:2-C-methyl-D-erythritol 2,4-cyclodiphosphate synthase
VCNIDTTVALELPKLRSHIDSIRESIAEIVGLEISRVSVKATTTERMGFVGRGEGATAYAVCLVDGDSSD